MTTIEGWALRCDEIQPSTIFSHTILMHTYFAQPIIVSLVPSSRGFCKYNKILVSTNWKMRSSPRQSFFKTGNVCIATSLVRLHGMAGAVWCMIS